MFENIKNYIDDEEYLISFMSNIIHIYNYLNINILGSKTIEVSFKNKFITIKGKDFYIKQLDIKEVLVYGSVSKVDYR